MLCLCWLSRLHVSIMLRECTVPYLVGLVMLGLQRRQVGRLVSVLVSQAMPQFRPET